MKNCTGEFCKKKKPTALSTTPVPTTTSAAPECHYPSRLCDNGTKCIEVERLCDEKYDCHDKSDEGIRCSKYIINMNSHPCSFMSAC